MTLIGYWPLNETEGNTAYDNSGNERHGGVENNTSQGEEGILTETSYRFSGGTGRVDTGEHIVTSNPHPFSISIWANFDDFDSDNNHEFFHEWDGSDGDRGWLLYWRSDVDEWTWLLRNSGGNSDRVSLSRTQNPGEWIHFVCTANPDSGTFKIYVNGNSAESNTWDGSFAGGINTIIGTRLDGRYSPRARLQEARLYNRVLTPGEVQYLYNVSKHGSFTSRKKSL